MATLAAKPVTVAEMEIEPDKWARFELYRGEPVEMTYLKPLHTRILGNVLYILKDWIVRGGGHGQVFGGEGGIKFGEHTRYCYDAAWSDSPVDDERIPTRSMPLMIEIVSESNAAERLIEKVEDYLKHGARQVWLIYGERRLLQVYQPDMTAKVYAADASYAPGELLPGFTLRVADLFA